MHLLDIDPKAKVGGMDADLESGTDTTHVISLSNVATAPQQGSYSNMKNGAPDIGATADGQGFRSDSAPVAAVKLMFL